MKGWGMKLTAVVVALTFLVSFSGMITGHAYAQEKGAAAAGKAGSEAGAATAAGISTGTIVAGVIAAAAIAAIAAASGGGGGAIEAAPTPSPAQTSAQGLVGAVSSQALTASDVVTIVNALADQELAYLIANMDENDIDWLAGLTKLGPEKQNELKKKLDNNPSLKAALTNLAKTDKFKQFQAQVKVLAQYKGNPKAYYEELKKLIDAISEVGSKFNIIFTPYHIGNNQWILTTAHH